MSRRHPINQLPSIHGLEHTSAGPTNTGGLDVIPVATTTSSGLLNNISGLYHDRLIGTGFFAPWMYWRAVDIRDRDYNVALDTDLVVATKSALTAPRVINLPAPDVNSDEFIVIFKDMLGTITGTNTITLHLDAGTFDNGTANIVLNVAFSAICVTSCNQTGQWHTLWTYPPTASLLQVPNTEIADVDYTATLSDYAITYTSLTATRTLTLPDIATAAIGQQFVIKDASNAGGGDIKIIDGGGNRIDWNGAFTVAANVNGCVTVKKSWIGSSNWDIVSYYYVGI